MSIKPDRIQFFSQLPNYIQLDTVRDTMVISGSVGAGATSTFSKTLTVDRNNTKSDVYATNGNTGLKALISSCNFPAVYQFASVERAVQVISYGTNSVTVAWSITNNTGAPIALTAQTITLDVIPYRLPI